MHQTALAEQRYALIMRYYVTIYAIATPLFICLASPPASSSSRSVHFLERDHLPDPSLSSAQKNIAFVSYEN